MQGTTAGAIVKRNGFARAATLPHNCYDLYAVDSNRFITYDNTTSSLLLVNGTSGVVSTLATPIGGPGWVWVRAPSVSGQGPYYGAAAGLVRQWDGSAASVSAWTNASGAVAVPAGQFMVYHKNQVFVAGVSSNPQRLYWSAIADPTNWDPASNTGAGYMDFDPNDNRPITGLGTVGPYLIVFKQTKTYVLVDAATATTRQLSRQVGAMATTSMAEAPEGTYFRGGDGQVYITNGSAITRVSDKISPSLDTNMPNGLLGGYGVYYNSHYYLSGGMGGVPVIFDYDARLQSWWKHTVGTNGVKGWALSVQSGDTPVLYAVNDAALSVAFSPGTYQDNGSNFTWSWSGPWQSPSFYRRRRFPTPYFRKRIRQIRLDGFGQVDVSLAKATGAALNPSASLIASDVFANASQSTLAKIYGQGVARAFSFVFSGTYNNPAQLNAYTVMLQDRRDSMVD